MNKEDLTNNVSKAALVLGEALQAMAVARSFATKAKRDEQAAVDSVLLEYFDDPKKMGANEATRDAFIRSRTAESLTHLSTRKDALAKAEGAVAVAQLDWEEARCQVSIWADSPATTNFVSIMKEGAYDDAIVQDVLNRLHRAGVRA